MTFDVRDLTPVGLLLALICVSVTTVVAVGCGLWSWDALSHAQIKSGRHVLILAGGLAGVATGWVVGALGAACARSQGWILARPKERDPDHDPGSSILAHGTMVVVLVLVWGGFWICTVSQGW
ncbi:MAG: hypothetical protein AAGD14_01380 [Planctomycetota bacterium]